MASVAWTDSALDDLDAISLNITRSAPAAAGAFVLRVFEATDLLEQFPNMGRRIPDSARHDVRELVVGDYLIAYRLSEAEVEILAVEHGARRRGPHD